MLEPWHGILAPAGTPKPLITRSEDPSTSSRNNPPIVPPEIPLPSLTEIEPSLSEMGELAGGELYRLQLQDRLNEPTLTQWDAWGNRIDRIEVSLLWQRAAQIASSMPARRKGRATARRAIPSPASSRRAPVLPALAEAATFPVGVGREGLRFLLFLDFDGEP